VLLVIAAKSGSLLVLLVDLDLVVGELDGVEDDSADDLAALPAVATVLGAEQVSELPDDPAALGVGGEAEDVVQPHVLEDLLPVPHLLLLRHREPHELGMGLIHGEGVILPGPPTVVGVDPRSPLAHRPGPVLVQA
jgi:hypothetical protein